MRSPVAAVLTSFLAGCLALSGCSVLSGDDDPAPSPSTTATRTDLPSTAWQQADPADVRRGGTLRLAAGSLPTNFNPLQVDAANSDAARILAPTTGGAVRITDDGGWEVDPAYAESVDVVDKSPLTIEVALNPKAVWQGGSPITGADMVAFWKAQNGSDDEYQVVSSAGYDKISAVEVDPDDAYRYTVVFDEPTAEWPRYVYPLLPKNVSASAKTFNTAFRKRAISSNGPYVVTSIDRRKGVIVEERNPRWWGDPPRLERITWNIAEPALQAKAYAAGELDAVDLQADTYATAKGTGTVGRAAGVEWSQVTMNGGRGPLADADVRRAVAHAIDRRTIASTAAKALGAPAAPLGSLLLVPGQRGYHDSTAALAYDPAAARALLEKAGWTKAADGTVQKDGKALTLTMPVPQGTPTNLARAKAIAADLAEVGITVDLTSAPAGVEFYEKVVIPLDFDLVTFQNTASPFPLAAAEPVYFPLDSAQNYTGVGIDRIGRGFQTVIGTLGDELRVKRIAKLDEWLFADPTIVPLAVTPLAVATRDGVVNYGASQFEEPDWTRVGFAADDADD